MTESQIMEMIKGWSYPRLYFEIDQAAAMAVDQSRCNEDAFAATAALVLMLREKDRRIEH